MTLEGKWYEKQGACSCKCKIWACVMCATSVKVEKKHTHKSINLEWVLFRVFFICSCIYFKLKKLSLYAATNEMSFSICNYHGNTVKAKGIKSFFNANKSVHTYCFFSTSNTRTQLKFCFLPRLRQLLYFSNAIL